ncbi:MAG: Lrp/AsnC family transcriptional regulator [Thermoplasmata archaeon]|nr:Lrp/AsnC family transcriptional regulator [Thermoplasmata archaeon]
MDATDFRLLVSLHQDARQSFRSLGREVGLSAPAVRERLDRLGGLGVLQGYWVRPDATIFGREDLLLLYQGDWGRGEVERALQSRDVAWIAWKIDGGLTAGLWTDQRADATRDLSQLLGAAPTAEVLAPRLRLAPLSLIDWKITDALLDDPRVELRTLCERTHLTPKTVRQHLRHLVDEGALSIAPRLGALNDSGELVYTLSVFGPIDFGEVREVLGDAALLRRTSTPKAQYVLCLAHSLGDVATRTERLAHHPQVTRSFVSLNRELFVRTSFARGLVQEAIRRLEDARRSPARCAPVPRPRRRAPAA